MALVWTEELETNVDNAFMQRVADEVQQSCALPMALPAERIAEYVKQGAEWMWENCDQAVEERCFMIKNGDIHKHDAMNKTICLPPQILGVFGCYKLQDNLKYNTMGDFSVERMLMSSYSMFGGAGIIGGGLGLTGGTGYTLSDVVFSLWEIDTFDQYLNPPITFNFNRYSRKLVILGDLGFSDLLLKVWKRCRIQDLYNFYYYFRYVVCLCKRALAQIYGAFSYKLPGGVEINYDMFRDQADSEIDEIKEYIDNQKSNYFFYMPNNV